MDAICGENPLVWSLPNLALHQNHLGSIWKPQTPKPCPSLQKRLSGIGSGFLRCYSFRRFWGEARCQRLMTGDGESSLTAVREEWNGDRRRKMGDREGVFRCVWLPKVVEVVKSGLTVTFAPRLVKAKDLGVLNPSLQSLILEDSRGKVRDRESKIFNMLSNLDIDTNSV